MHVNCQCVSFISYEHNACWLLYSIMSRLTFEHLSIVGMLIRGLPVITKIGRHLNYARSCSINYEDKLTR